MLAKESNTTFFVGYDNSTLAMVNIIDKNCWFKSQAVLSGLSLVLLFFGLFVVQFSYAQSEGNLLQQAAAAYAQENYEAAIDLYEQVLTSGKEAFELYYNLGNAYFKTDQIGPAILNYERAARLAPADPDLQHNLALAQARTVDKIDMVPVPELITGYKSFVNRFSADTWGVFSIVAFILLLIAIGSFLLFSAKWLKQLFLTIAGVLLVLTLIFFFFGWQQQSWLNNRKEAIVFSPSTRVVSAPNDTGTELFVLHEGTKVRVEERFREWVRIRIGNGNSGWVPEEVIEEI